MVSLGYAAAFRVGLQRHAAAKDQRIVSSLSASAEERYQEFVRMYPSIVRRVPQSMLASYLGMTPETVSRIRKKLSRGTTPKPRGGATPRHKDRRGNVDGKNGSRL